MSLVILGVTFALLSLGCSLFILFHAFQRSLGTGVMVLCVPCFIIYYAFSQFEHRRKGLIVASWLGSMLVAMVLYTYAAQGLVAFVPPRLPS